MSIVWGVVLVIVLLALWTLHVFSLPANWLMLLAASLYVWLAPVEGSAAIGWWPTLVALAVLALMGEGLELLASALGVKVYGGSRRGAVLAMIGSLVGAVIGIFVGLPIPYVGSILAALLFAGLGAMVGAVLGEQWAGRSPEESWKIGAAAFVGRLLGTAGKMAVGAAMIAVVVVALWLE